MMFKARTLLVAVLALSQVIAVTPPASAQGVMEFDCAIAYPLWPGGGGSCSGGASYHFGVPGATQCVRTCAFDAGVTPISETCGPVGGFPPTGSFFMDVNVHGVYADTYRVERTLFHLTYYDPDLDEPVGEGEWSPVPPWGACGASLPMNARITGRVLVP